jgi:integrase/recombinase XerD
MTTESHEYAAAKFPFEEAVRLYLMECKFRNFSSESIRKYRYSLKNVQECLESHQLEWSSLTQRDLTHTILPDLLEQLSVRTVNCILCILKGFFNFHVEEQRIPANIAADIKLFKIDQQLIHTFSDEQLQALLSQPDRSTFTGYRNYIMMLVLLDTGMRLKELAGLQIKDVDFTEQIIHIRLGKGRKSRNVPIQRTCLMQLRLYLMERGSEAHDFLWTNLDNRPFETAGIRVMMARYCKKAKIVGIQCSCHTFRHTMAKKYLLNGGDIFTLQRILGHAKIETTRYYVELFSQDLQEQHEKYSPVENMLEEFPDLIDAEEGKPI